MASRSRLCSRTHAAYSPAGPGAPLAWAVWLIVGVGGKVSALALGKFEPPTGCYVGAFVEKDDRVLGDFAEFEKLTRKKHASYFTYVGYGRLFPAEWVEKVKGCGAAPHLALEPNEGLDPVKDDDYLRQWARDAYAADCPIFLRFASEMNGSWSAYYGNPKQYVEKFRLVHDVMEQLAPNVALVWTPFAVPQRNLQAYYPGDDYVDWVGVNIYSVYVHNGDPGQPASEEDPIGFLRFIYETYAERKPIQISEFAATHFCRAVNRSTETFAVAKMKRFYQTIAQSFPRVRMINWFSFDSLGHGIADNNYSLTANKSVLDTYCALIAPEYFLSEVPYERDKYRLALGPAPPRVPALPVPPPLPDLLPPAPPAQSLAASTEEDWLALLTTRGANATQVSALTLQGVHAGQEVAEATELVAVVPSRIQAVYALFELDGRVIHGTNVAPFRCHLAPASLTPGTHEVRVVVTDRAGQERATNLIPFRVPGAPQP